MPPSIGMRIASVLGVLAVAHAFFLAFRSYALYVPEAAIIGLLVAGSVGTLLAAFWVRARDETGYFARLAAIVAFAAFVTNLAVLARIFNFTSVEGLFVAWAALAFGLAYTFRSKLLLAAGILGAIGLSVSLLGVAWMNTEARPENLLLLALLLFLVAIYLPQGAFPGFAPLYLAAALVVLLVPILFLAATGMGSHLPLAQHELQRLYYILGLGVSAVAVWLGARRRWPAIVCVGATTSVLLIAIRFHDPCCATPTAAVLPIIAVTSAAFIVLMVGLRAVLTAINERKVRS